MKDRLSLILEDKGSEVFAVGPNVTVVDAVYTMNEHGVGSVLVLEDGLLHGIFSERDVLRRVVATGRDPSMTPVSEVMTERVLTVSPDTTVEEAMAIVTESRCRHLPVLEKGELRGLVSSGDLTRRVSRERKFEIDRLVEYVTRQYPA